MKQLSSHLTSREIEEYIRDGYGENASPQAVAIESHIEDCNSKLRAIWPRTGQGRDGPAMHCEGMYLDTARALLSRLPDHSRCN